jgi:hypothetical protein
VQQPGWAALKEVSVDPDIYKVLSWNQGDFLGALSFYARAHGTEVKENLDFGICQTLSLKWIQLKLQEIQQHQRADSAERMHEMTDSLFDAVAIQEKEKTPFALEAKRAYQLMERPHPANRNAEYVAAIVTQRSHACYMAVLQIRHAIAIYQSSGKIFGINKHVYIYDPNEGEYKVYSALFPDWLKAFLRKHYDNAQSFAEFYEYSLI